eukprot:15363786-Ditylum_brightwellii.AAC.1
MTIKEYISRVQKILNADMIGDYTMNAICDFVLPVLQYMFGIMKWTKGELRKLNIKTRKMLTMKGIYHPKGVEDTHNYKYAALSKYVLNSTDPLMQMMQNTPTPTQKFFLKFVSSPKFMLPELTDDNHHKCLSKKPLHGKFFCQQAEIPQVGLGQSYQQLRQAQFRSETKAAICAAQEQIMVTNYIRKEIFKQDVDPLCCLCRKENEMISHIVSGCEVLASIKYTKSHNNICQYLYWCILQDYNIAVNPNWWTHKPKPPTLISNQLSVTYNMTQEVDNVVEANRL